MTGHVNIYQTTYNFIQNLTDTTLRQKSDTTTAKKGYTWKPFKISSPFGAILNTHTRIPAQQYPNPFLRVQMALHNCCQKATCSFELVWSAISFLFLSQNYNCSNIQLEFLGITKKHNNIPACLTYSPYLEWSDIIYDNYVMTSVYVCCADRCIVGSGVDAFGNFTA